MELLRVAVFHNSSSDVEDSRYHGLNAVAGLPRQDVAFATEKTSVSPYNFVLMPVVLFSAESG